MRQGRKRGRRNEAVRQQPWRNLRRSIEPVKLLSDDQVEAIHRATLEILRDTGIEFMSERALDVLDRPGVTLDRDTGLARFDPDFIEETIATASATFRIHARNPDHDIHVGGDSVNFCNATTPPYCSDLEGGRRAGTFADFESLLKLNQALNIVHFLFGYPVEPQDLPPETRHLDSYRAYATLTDKVWRGYTLGDDRINDALEIARIARGITPEQMEAEPSLLANVTTNSPLRIDGPMGDGMIAMAERLQPVTISAFTMAGAMAPVTLAGALAQQNAEIMSAVAFSQMVRPGAPVAYGALTLSVDMRSGAVSMGTPEYVRATLASGQLARRYGIPFKSANTNSSNAVDAQAAYESQMSLWAAIVGGGHIVAHGVGMLESAMTTSYEKMVIDAEMLQMMAEVIKPLRVDDTTLATEAIHEVGPGGHFLDNSMTLERYETAFYDPMLSDWSNFETWTERGAKTAEVRANELWKRLLDEYEPPPIDAAVAEEIDDYVARRRAEIEAG